MPFCSKESICPMRAKTMCLFLVLLFLFLQPVHRALNKHLLMDWSLGEPANLSPESDRLLSPFCLPARSEHSQRLWLSCSGEWCYDISDLSENPSSPESEAAPGDLPDGCGWTCSSQIQCLLSPHWTWISEALFTMDLPPHMFSSHIIRMFDYDSVFIFW